jgi:hypothetical protein
VDLSRCRNRLDEGDRRDAGRQSEEVLRLAKCRQREAGRSSIDGQERGIQAIDMIMVAAFGIE